MTSMSRAKRICDMVLQKELPANEDFPVENTNENLTSNSVKKMGKFSNN